MTSAESFRVEFFVADIDFVDKISSGDDLDVDDCVRIGSAGEFLTDNDLDASDNFFDKEFDDSSFEKDLMTFGDNVSDAKWSVGDDFSNKISDNEFASTTSAALSLFSLLLISFRDSVFESLAGVWLELFEKHLDVVLDGPGSLIFVWSSWSSTDSLVDRFWSGDT